MSVHLVSSFLMVITMPSTIMREDYHYNVLYSINKAEKPKRTIKKNFAVHGNRDTRHVKNLS